VSNESWHITALEPVWCTLPIKCPQHLHMLLALKSGRAQTAR